MLTPVARRPRGAHGWMTSTSEALDWVRAVVAEPTDTGCRDWPGYRSPKGYGQMGYEDRTRLVGHVVLEMSGRPRPPGAHQLHSCDRPVCAAPWHLRWGTNAENRAEMVARGRSCRGEAKHLAKLTDEAVRVIRTSPATCSELARQYGVLLGTIWKARVGETWKHVDVAPCTVDESGRVGVYIEDGQIAVPAQVGGS